MAAVLAAKAVPTWRSWAPAWIAVLFSIASVFGAYGSYRAKQQMTDDTLIVLKESVKDLKDGLDENGKEMKALQKELSELRVEIAKEKQYHAR